MVIAASIAAAYEAGHDDAWGVHMWQTIANGGAWVLAVVWSLLMTVAVWRHRRCREK